MMFILITYQDLFWVEKGKNVNVPIWKALSIPCLFVFLYHEEEFRYNDIYHGSVCYTMLKSHQPSPSNIFTVSLILLFFAKKMA